MKVLISLSMPHIFSDSYIPDDLLTEEAEKAFLVHTAKKRKLICSFEGLKIYSGESPISRKTVYFASSEDNEHCLYYVELLMAQVPRELQHLLNRRTTTQTAVWKAKNIPLHQAGIASFFFWKYLISKTRSILSDSMQSDAGSRFWFNRVNEALLRKIDYQVVVVKGRLLTADKKLLVSEFFEIIKSSDMSKFYTRGDVDTSGLSYRFIITKL